MKRKTVFFSYSSKDKYLLSNFTRQLKEYCELAGIIVEPIIDKEVLRAGEDWQKKLEDHIHESEYFIVLLTRQSIESEEVEKEVHIALQVRPTGFIPVLLDGSDIPSYIKAKHVIVHAGDDEEFFGKIISKFDGKSDKKPNLYVVSLGGRHVGRTSTIVGLKEILYSSAGYVKPFHYEDDDTSLLDLNFIRTFFDLSDSITDDLLAPLSHAPVDKLSPTTLKVLQDKFQELKKKIGHERPILIEGLLNPPGQITLKQMIELYNAYLVIVINLYEYKWDKWYHILDDSLNDILYAVREELGKVFPIGVVLNKFPYSLEDVLGSQEYDKYRENLSPIYNFDDLGVIPFDPRLSGVSINDICEQLKGVYVYPNSETDQKEASILKQRLIWSPHFALFERKEMEDYFNDLIEREHGPGGIIAISPDGDSYLQRHLWLIRRGIGCLVLTAGHSHLPEQFDKSLIEAANEYSVPIIHVQKENIKVVQYIEDMIGQWPFSSHEKVQIIAAYLKKNITAWRNLTKARPEVTKD